MRSKSYITPRPSELIKSTSATNIPKFVGCFSSNSSAANTPLRYLAKIACHTLLKDNSLLTALFSFLNLCSVMDRESNRKRSMIPRYMGTAASIEALTELRPVPDDREEELVALESPSDTTSVRYFGLIPNFLSFFQSFFFTFVD